MSLHVLRNYTRILCITPFCGFVELRLLDLENECPTMEGMEETCIQRDS